MAVHGKMEEYEKLTVLGRNWLLPIPSLWPCSNCCIMHRTAMKGGAHTPCRCINTWAPPSTGVLAVRHATELWSISTQDCHTCTTRYVRCFADTKQTQTTLRYERTCTRVSVPPLREPVCLSLVSSSWQCWLLSGNSCRGEGGRGQTNSP